MHEQQIVDARTHISSPPSLPPSLPPSPPSSPPLPSSPPTGRQDVLSFRGDQPQVPEGGDSQHHSLYLADGREREREGGRKGEWVKMRENTLVYICSSAVCGGKAIYFRCSFSLRVDSSCLPPSLPPSLIEIPPPHLAQYPPPRPRRSF